MVMMEDDCAVWIGRRGLRVRGRDAARVGESGQAIGEIKLLCFEDEKSRSGT